MDPSILDYWIFLLLVVTGQGGLDHQYHPLGTDVGQNKVYMNEPLGRSDPVEGGGEGLFGAELQKDAIEKLIFTC